MADTAGASGEEAGVEAEVEEEVEDGREPLDVIWPSVVLCLGLAAHTTRAEGEQRTPTAQPNERCKALWFPHEQKGKHALAVTRTRVTQCKRQGRAVAMGGRRRWLLEMDNTHTTTTTTTTTNQQQARRRASAFLHVRWVGVTTSL